MHFAHETAWTIGLRGMNLDETPSTTTPICQWTKQRSFLEELADRVFDRAYQRAADASRRVRAHKRLADAQKAYQCGPNPISK